MTKITKQPDSILDQGEFEYWTTTETGIVFKPGTTRDVWLGAMEKILGMFENSGRLHFRSICILGDAMNFGENSEFSAEVAQAIDSTRKYLQLSYKTIQNAAWICARIESSRRRETLTLSHHEAVAVLAPDEQDELLAKAESENMSVSALKAEVKKRHPKDGKPSGSRKVIIDLKSEEGLQHAGDSIVKYFEELDAEAKGGKADLKGIEEGRKVKWACLTAIAKYARRMGIGR